MVTTIVNRLRDWWLFHFGTVHEINWAATLANARRMMREPEEPKYAGDIDEHIRRKREYLKGLQGAAELSKK